MNKRCSIVITTINHPTLAVKEIAKNLGRIDASFILVGDQKSPVDFEQPGATYLDLDAQRKTGFRYAEIAPTRHYARKNIGYLVGIRDGAEIIVETDDDNVPLESFWQSRNPLVQGQLVEGTDWVNVYRYFTESLIWPRGLPLDRVTAPAPAPTAQPDELYCPIQQGLADGDPDVDAIYRLILPLPLQFAKREPVVLRGAWCPFNSQNTTWWPEAFPLLYLPYHCSFRMTDIWRSFVAQRIAYRNGWGISFHNATVFQDRNEHNLMRDFEEEIPGYLNNHHIREMLDELDLPGGPGAIGEAMRLCYRRLVEAKQVGADELPLLDAWLQDLSTLDAASTRTEEHA